jgi:hypothetical protein
MVLNDRPLLAVSRHSSVTAFSYLSVAYSLWTLKISTRPLLAAMPAGIQRAISVPLEASAKAAQATARRQVSNH